MAKSPNGKPAARSDRKLRTRTPRRTGTPAPAAKVAAAGPDNPLLDLEGALAMLGTSRQTFYRWLRTGRIKGHKLGRQWRFYRQDLEAFLKGAEPRVDLPVDIGPLNAELARQIEAACPAGEGAKGKLSLLADEPDVARTARLIIRLAVLMKGRVSDFDIGPASLPDGTTVGQIRFRIDGCLHKVAEFDSRLVSGLIAHWKRLGACDPQERKRPQDARIMLSESDNLPAGKNLDIRVCFLPLATGEMMTARVLDRSTMILDLDRMDLPPADRGRLAEAIDLPFGLVVVGGPVGSGKTTLLYSLLKRLARPETKIMTMEDPVEYLIPGVDQTQFNPTIGLSYAASVRPILRSDPDVIMVGEIRDRETLHVAIEATLTGRLVFTVLHTDEAASSLRRMVEIGVDPFLVADASRLMVATRLVRKLCPACSKPVDFSRPAGSGSFLPRAERLVRGGGVDWDAMEKNFRDPAPGGCAQCGRTGYRGRQLLIETLRVTPEIGVALRRGATADELRAIAVSQGMTTLPAAGVRLAGAGVTSLNEVFSVWRE